MENHCRVRRSDAAAFTGRKKRFAQVLPGRLEATFGGGEANVCASLALFGNRVRYLTALPENPVSAAFAAQMRGIGVEVDRIHYAKTGRMGVYYAEHGAAQRGSSVVYDREGSSIALLEPEAYDFDSMLDGVGHLHLTGITPSLSGAAFRTTLELARRAARGRSPSPVTSITARNSGTGNRVLRGVCWPNAAWRRSCRWRTG